MESPNLEKVFEIYCITNTVNQKRYVGLTCVGAKNRWYKHRWLALKKLMNTHFYEGIRKHGPEVFRLSVLQECSSLDEANDAERRWIHELATTDPRYGYNTTSGGDQKAGWKMTPEARRKISDSKLGRIMISRREHTMEEDRPIVDLFKEGLTRNEIQERLNVTPAKVQKALARWKARVDPGLAVGRELQYVNSGRSLQERADRENEPIVTRFKKGMSRREIANEFHVSYHRVKQAILRARRRGMFDEEDD